MVRSKQRYTIVLDKILRSPGARKGSLRMTKIAAVQSMNDIEIMNSGMTNVMLPISQAVFKLEHSSLLT